MILNRQIYLILSVFIGLSSSQIALAAKPMACTKLFAEAPTRNKTEKPKEALPIEIVDADSFAEAMTKGMLLNATQGDLFGIYLAMYLGDPKTNLEGNSFVTVQEILKQHPELQKTHFPEYEISKVVKIYESSESLNQYIRSQLSTVGQMRSNLFQVDANLGFWKKLLDYKDLKAIDGSTKEAQKEISEKNKARFSKYLSKVISPENRDLLKNEKIDYEVKVTVLFKTLDQLRNHFEKNKKDSKLIRQTMVDLVHTTGYFNVATLSLLKSQDGLQRIEGLNKIIDERESMAMSLGFDGHFVELLQKLNIPYPSLTGVPEAVTAKTIAALDKEIKKGKFITKTTDSVRVRSLSIQEAGFRSCLGGSDCSTRTYFSKAFDPNYNYFTMTNKENRSSGHATVVLGTAVDAKGKFIKVAFLDKLQNVPDQLVIEFLQAVQKSLKDKGYKLGIPEDLSGHNGLSNMANTLSFVKQNVIPGLSSVLTDFSPEAHDYNFRNEYSRAYERLPMRVFDMKPDVLENTEIRPGVYYKPYAADPNLRKEALVTKFLLLRSSKNPDEVMQYITSIRTVDLLQQQGLFSRKDFLADLESIFKNLTNSYKIRKTAWLEFYQQTNWDNSNIELTWKDFFSVNERANLIKEIRDWSDSTNQDRKNFSQKFFRMMFALASNHARNYKNQSAGIEALKVLYENHLIDINAKDEKGNTLFHLAVKAEAVEIAKYLGTIPGIKLNEINNEKYTALVGVWGKYGIAKQILTIPGVDVNAKNSSGDTILDMWVLNGNQYPGHLDRVKFLLGLPGIDKNTKNKYGQSVLIYALYNKEIFELFLAQPGIDYNVVDDEGHSLLEKARLEENEESFLLLLKAPGIKIDPESNRYRHFILTKLIYAPGDKAEHYQTIKSILNISEVNRSTPLETANILFPLAAAFDDVATMEKLLEVPGLDINHGIADEKYEEGLISTAIDFAVKMGSAKAVKFLLHRSELRIKNFNDDEGLLCDAIRKNHLEIFELLLKVPGAKAAPWPLFRAMQLGLPGRIYFEKLLQIPIVDLNKPVFNGRNRTKEPLLLQTFDYGNVWHLKQLLKLSDIQVNFRYEKEFPNEPTFYGETLLYKALRDRSSDSTETIEFVEALVADPRLDITLIDEHGYSALMIALSRQSTEDELVTVLNKLLPRMDQRTINFVSDKTKGTALTRAKKYWSDQVVEILKAAGAHE